jgi:2-dehydro-3-deoxyphosphogluconate aldolase/(4S)-4-hydroxy-2-oxoglutarate aldolase
VLTVQDVEQAIAAGAQFLFSPHTQPQLIHAASAQGIPIIPGALSPTEIVTAWQAGATGVKVFPIKAVGGASYIRCLQGPLGHIPLIPTGGVTLDNATEMLAAGAIAVGLSSSLFPKTLVQAQDWPTITARSQAFMQQIQASGIREPSP